MEKIIFTALLSTAFTFHYAQELRPFKKNNKWGYVEPRIGW